MSLTSPRRRLGLFDVLDGAAHAAAKANGNGHVAPPSNLPDLPELSEAERLANEKKALGFYMSSHPLTRHATLLQALATHRVGELAGVAEKTEVILGGMIANVQVRNVQLLHEILAVAGSRQLAAPHVAQHRQHALGPPLSSEAAAQLVHGRVEVGIVIPKLNGLEAMMVQSPEKRPAKSPL